MSTFYGMVKGNRKCATRGGSKSSGFRASCQSYAGSIISAMEYVEDENGKEVLKVRVGTNDGSSACSDWNSNDFTGTFQEFKDLLKLAADIKSGKVSIVRHREKSNKMKQLEKIFG